MEQEAYVLANGDGIVSEGVEYKDVPVYMSEDLIYQEGTDAIEVTYADVQHEEQVEAKEEVVEEEDVGNTTTTLVITEFNKICRICLQPNEGLKTLYDIVWNNITVLYLLQKYVSPQILSMSHLPSSICPACASTLLRFHKFKAKAKNNENILQTLYDNGLITNIKEENVEELEDGEELEEEVDDECYEVATEVVETMDTECEVVETENSIHTATLNDNRIEKCGSCEEKFDNSEDLEMHLLETGHTKVKVKMCSECGMMIIATKFNQHMRTHNTEKTFSCKICSRTFSLSANLDRHSVVHSGEKPYICEVCGKSFTQLGTLRQHQENHNGKFQCKICSERFHKTMEYCKHLKVHQTDDTASNYECAACDESFPNMFLLRNHLVTHVKLMDKLYECELCSKKFASRNGYTNHMNYHQGIKRHKCKYCDKQFTQASSLYQHMKVHTMQKPYECKTCLRRFSQQTHLTYHQRVHTGERPFACPYCGKTFALNGNLTVHIRRHTQEKPYKCRVCDIGFYDSSSRKKHEVKHDKISHIGQLYSVAESNDKYSSE